MDSEFQKPQNLKLLLWVVVSASRLGTCARRRASSHDVMGPPTSSYNGTLPHEAFLIKTSPFLSGRAWEKQEFSKIPHSTHGASSPQTELHPSFAEETLGLGYNTAMWSSLLVFSWSRTTEKRLEITLRGSIFSLTSLVKNTICCPPMLGNVKHIASVEISKTCREDLKLS